MQRRMMLKPEQKTQIAILTWLELYDKTAREHIIHIQNEGKRSIQGHILANRMGLHKGCSDLFLPLKRNGFNGLFVEVKPDGWKPRNAAEKERVERQKAFLYKMMAQGYEGAFVVGVDEGIEVFARYLKD